ncbi:MAG: hypothetical protein IJO60_05255 [Agathobacter sp.]|nr:hypothetical protein [Agathobacter sp.]
MNKVLLVGNGFDLAHGLHTSYGNFLNIMKNRDNFDRAIDYYMKNGKPLEASNFYHYFKDIKSLREDNLKKLQEILKTNSWVFYFSECEAEIDGWIDFEREIYPVIELFEHIFMLDSYEISKSGSKRISIAYINMSELNSNLLRTTRLWEKYFSFNAGFHVKAPYVSSQYGILKKKILQSLREEFDEFIKAFEIYLLEFVDSVEHKEVLQQIKDINADFVISFNYTRTEDLYGISQDNVHHLHGVIREDVKEDKYGKNANGEKNNMVMGVNEQKDQNMDFIYFVKYFQRIQKASGTRYKGFVDKYHTDSWGQQIKDKYELYVYGHSLDETDEDILKYLIGDKDETGDLDIKPDKVSIYYYNQTDYEQKVINLIKLYGRSIVEEYMECDKFEFIPIEDTKSKL